MALTVQVTSFGFKYSGPPVDPHGNGGGFVFDCRALPNPFWEETLRDYTGRDAEIIQFMEQYPEVNVFAAHAQALVLATAQTYTQRDYNHLLVAFGCTGGRHRSVYQAEQMTHALENAGFAWQLTHSDILQKGPSPKTP